MTENRVVDPLALENKIAVVMSPDLNAGQMVNRSAVLATGLTAHHPEIVGPDLQTGDGLTLPGITKVPIVVLKTKNPDDVVPLSQKALNSGCTTLFYLSRAQGLRSYESYSRMISDTLAENLDVDAFIIYGPQKSVNKVTGNLPIIR